MKRIKCDNCGRVFGWNGEPMVGDERLHGKHNPLIYEVMTHPKWPKDELAFTLQWREIDWPYFWRFRQHLRRVRGSGTVWHWLVSGDRCPTYLEAYLADRWTEERWKLEDKYNPKAEEHR